jgi:hypothetical protein
LLSDHGFEAEPNGHKMNGGAGGDRLTVLLADDHHLFREGLRQLLEATGEINVVG